MAGIYIHIPFCKQACNYCNFHFSTSLKTKTAVVDAICKELELRQDYLSGQVVTTVYFGGGTPSLLNHAEIMQIWESINRHFPNIGLQECTFETNPDDVNHDFLKMLKATPVNRLSMGVQSFVESDLQFMHRAHNATEAEYAIKSAQEAGFDNLSIDLIYGTPGLDNKSWQENLEKTIAFQIPHVSAYALTVEEKTLLAHQIAKGQRKAPMSEQAATQFELMIDLLSAANYEHYEISNFAKRNAHAIHNTSYWKGVHYLGIGPSAHSFNGASRQWNVANNAVYAKGIMTLQPQLETEILSATNRINEYIMTSLRTMWGLNLRYIEAQFGKEYALQIVQKMQEHIMQNHVQKNSEQFVLTRAGKLFADRIASDLFFG